MAFHRLKRDWASCGIGCIVGAFLLCGAAKGQRAASGRSTTTRAQSPWERAERQRETFEAQPAHTRAEYARILDQYRAIYHADPANVHAPEAVYTVAELLRDQGRELNDATSLRNAVAQYEFLRTQYPGSSLRLTALLEEARIEDRDLKDPSLARQKYTELQREAPRSKAASEARGEVADLGQQASAVTDRKPQPGAQKKPEPAVAGLALTEQNVRRLESHAAPAPVPEQAVSTETQLAPPPVESRRTSLTRSAAPLAQVSGIRHWSTPTYTRVAIDLGGEVTFEAARVPNPDRIYFDLHGAKLDSDLIGKSFSVTDDGFLKRIRAAQATGDVTRVVLDVSNVTEYSAFLLPNPYRLIIDIHGAKAQAPQPLAQPAETIAVAAGDTQRASAAANSSGLPAMAPTDGSGPVRQPTLAAAKISRPAPLVRPVPNTVAVREPATTSEVAAVSDAPGRIDATSAPTSKPIAASVPSPVPVPRDAALGTGRRKRAKSPDAVVAGDAAPAKAADKTADGETSMIRALGLKINRIVIDAGHGGHDSGTLGADGIEEKDVVLDVALRLGKLLHDRLGAEIIYTRSDDTFIPLETRTAIANKAQADLFISVHANSSQDESARGVETYYLNFTSDPTALDVAARENAVSDQSIHQLSDLVKKITLKDKIDESREFASDVEGSLYAGLARGNDGLKNRGVKKAPFVVLIGANMPSILAEISFVTNPRDAAQLRQPEYRERVAESLYTGVAKYESGLAGSRTPPVTRAARDGQ